MELEDLLRLERADFMALVTGLAPDEWARPSLCAGWSVQDVVGHVLANDEIGMFGYIGGVVRAGLRPAHHAEAVRRRWRERDPDQIVAFARGLEHPRAMAKSMFKYAPLILFTETFVHQQDVRRAIGWGREVDEGRMVAVLDAMVHTSAGVSARRKVAGLRVRATDVDYVSGAPIGKGPEVYGPAEVLVMTIAGRVVDRGALGGDGARVLLDRVTGATARVGDSHVGQHATPESRPRQAATALAREVSTQSAKLRSRLTRRTDPPAAAHAAADGEDTIDQRRVPA